MNQKKLVAVLALCFSVLSLQASAQGEAKVIHVTDMTPQLWAQIKSGELVDATVEFRQGDVLPVVFQSTGDLLETTQANPSYVTVKKSFWIKDASGFILLSLDGSSFQPFRNLVSGTITADATGSDQGGIANAINVVFNAVLK